MSDARRAAVAANRWRARIVDWVPLPFLTHAHELATAVIILVMGLPAALGLLPGQGTEHDPLPFPMWETWGASMVLASVATIWGVFASRPRMEWSGQMLTGWGLLFWAGVLAALDAASYVTVGVFVTLSLVSFWRAFKITSQPFVQYRLTKAAKAAHVRVREEQPGRRRT